MIDCYHLTELASGAYSVGPCESPPHARRALEEGPEITTAPRAWVEAWSGAQGRDLHDATIRQAIRAWDRWLRDPEIATMALPADGGPALRGQIQTTLFVEYGFSGQDASSIIEATIDALGRARIAAGVGW